MLSTDQCMLMLMYEMGDGMGSLGYRCYCYNVTYLRLNICDLIVNIIER